MKKLDQFIIKAFLLPFIAILLIVVFILMMQFLWLYIDELVGKGLGIRVILEFLMWGICTILPLAMPLATLLASLMTLGQMGENNELMAIRAAGISLARILIPLSVIAVLISVAAYFVGNNLVPKAYDEIFTLRDDIGKTKEEINIPSGTFYDGIDGYILRVDSQDKSTKVMYGVMVYDHSGSRGNTAVTIADSAMMRMSASKDYLTFTLFNGESYQENNTFHFRDTTLELQKISFRRQDLIIPLRNYAFEHSDTSRFGDQVKAKKAGELSYQQDSLRRTLKIKHDENYKTLFESRSPFTLGEQLDTSRAGNLPSEMFSRKDFGVWDTYSGKAYSCRLAKENAERMAGDLASFHQSSFEYNFFLSRTEIELLKKFAQALACLILFFIGAPLGAIIRKGGLGTSAIISILFFVLYWVVDISGTKLARDGAIDAFTGAFISAYVLIPIGVYFCWQAIHDSQIMNFDAVKSWFKRLWSIISRYFHQTRIVYMGTPEFAVAPLDALMKDQKRKGFKVVGVVTVADKPSGRGLKVNESAVKQYAVANGLPVLQPVKLKDPEFLAALKAWKADLFVVVAFRMLPEEVWKMPRLGTFNLHAALLPQYRGAAPINWAVINGERITGATTFMIDKNIDTGGIILRQEIRIGTEDTAGDVHDRLMDIGSALVSETVEGIIQGNVELRVQRSFIQGSEILKPAPKLTKELCHIDWNDSASSIHNLIRGLSPYPTAFTGLVNADGTDAGILKIYSSTVSRERNLQGTKPGTILSDGRTYLSVTTADGALDILELQLSGKKRMGIEEFLRGFHNPETFSCDSGTSKSETEKTRQC